MVFVLPDIICLDLCLDKVLGYDALALSWVLGLLSRYCMHALRHIFIRKVQTQGDFKCDDCDTIPTAS